MKISDITNDYITKNFDIDKNRKIKKERKEVCDLDIDSVLQNHRLFDDKIDFDVFWNAIRDEYKTQTKMALKEYQKLKGFINAQFYLKINTIYEIDAHPFETSEEGFQFLIHADVEQKETDQQVIGRLKSREKQKLKNKDNKAKKENLKRKQLDKLAKELNVEIKNK